MFKKIKCKCGRKLSNKFKFCPYCGNILDKQNYQKREKKGKDENALLDEIEQIEKAFNIPFFMKPLIRQLAKQIDKQFKNMDKKIGTEGKQIFEKELNEMMKKMPLGINGVSISISSSDEGPLTIKVKKLGEISPGISGGIKNEKNVKDEEIKLPKRKMNKIEEKKFAKLPRVEPGTKVRRFTDKIVYEIDLPGVKQEKNIIISKLQNSIEVKAFAKDKAYFKLIPLDLAIKSYKLEKEKLILELKP